MRLREDFEMYGAGGATCYLCGGGPNGEPVLDTERDIDMEGRLGLCAGCVADMARLYGWITPDEADTIKKRAAKQVTKAEDDAAKLRDRLSERLHEALA